MKISDKELENFKKNIGEAPFINMTRENVAILRSIINELIKLREIGDKYDRIMDALDDMPIDIEDILKED